MVRRPLQAITMAWQLGVQLWLMRLASAPCKCGAGRWGGARSLNLAGTGRCKASQPAYPDYACCESKLEWAFNAKPCCSFSKYGATHCALHCSRLGRECSGPLPTHLGGGVDEEHVVAVGVVLGPLQHDVVKVGQLVPGDLLHRILRAVPGVGHTVMALSSGPGSADARPRSTQQPGKRFLQPGGA